MKVLSDLQLQFGDPLWVLNPELAVIDTILESHTEIYDLVKGDITKGKESSKIGRQDMPAVEQVLRAAIYKEIKNLTYRELEYEQHDSKICELFIKLQGRKPYSFEVLHKYISKISSESLKKVMIEINKVGITEGLEDVSKVRTDSTVVETNIHYPTNNALVWDCIKDIQRLVKNLKKSGIIKVRNYTKQAKKNHYKINNTKSKEKRKEEFKKQIKLFRTSINQAEKIIVSLSLRNDLDIKEWAIVESLKGLLPKAEKVYDISYRHEILGEKVPNEEKIFSIYEEHTDIIVKGSREVEFGHKVNLTTGKSNLILDCDVLDGNPSDTKIYEGVIDRVKGNYGITPRDIVTDGGYASLENMGIAKEKGLTNIVFNKIVGSLKNIVSSKSMETRLKKWRSGIEAVISNLKRGFDIFRCEWKTRTRFDAKVLWSVIAYNIRVMTSLLIPKLQPQSQ